MSKCNKPTLKTFVKDSRYQMMDAGDMLFFTTLFPSFGCDLAQANDMDYQSLLPSNSFWQGNERLQKQIMAGISSQADASAKRVAGEACISQVPALRPKKVKR